MDMNFNKGTEMSKQLFKNYGSDLKKFEKDVEYYESLGYILTYYNMNEGKDIQATFLKPFGGI